MTQYANNVCVKHVCYICTQQPIYQFIKLIYAILVWKRLYNKYSQTYVSMIWHQRANIRVIKNVPVSRDETLVVCLAVGLKDVSVRQPLGRLSFCEISGI